MLASVMKDFQALLFLAYFPFFQITSDYVILCFPRPSFGETTTTLKAL